MLEKIQLYQIYESVIDKIPLTKQLLTSFGMEETSINKLIKEDILTETTKDNYILSSSSIKKLYYYHGILLKRDLTERAIECIGKCLELEPNNREMSFGLIRIYIRIKKYNKVFEIFKELDNTSNIELQKDNNLYLYLFSVICNYPKEYKERVLNLKYSDIEVSKNSEIYTDIDTQNKIRMHLIQGRFSLVTKIYNEQITKIFPNVEERSLLQELLKQAKSAEEIKYFSLENLVKTRKYKETVNYIESLRTTKKVSMFDAFVYYISKKITIIETTKKIPSVKILRTSNLKEALQGDNYILLLSLIKKTDAFNGKEKEILTILIVNIIKLIEELKNNQQEKENKIEDEIDKIISLYKSNKIDESIELLKSYLKSINKEEDEYIALNLLKLGALDNFDFSQFKTFLTKIRESNYTLNIFEYIDLCNDSISKYKLDIASIYLEIVKKLKTKEVLEENPSLKRRIPNMAHKLGKCKEELAALLECLDFLKQSADPTMLITNLSNNKRAHIIDIARNIKHLTPFRTGGKDSNDLLLRYIEKQEEIDKSAFTEEIIKSYLDGKYNECINMSLKLIRSSYTINPKLYAILGISYIKNDNLEKAIKFLSIAKGIYEERKNIEYDLTDLIKYLQVEPSKENNLKINNFIKEFNFSLTECNINLLEELAYFINENNLSLEEAIIKYNLKEEQILIIKLIYARDYYIDGLISLGNKLLKEVEKNPNKTPLVKSFLNEITSKRNLYRGKEELHTKRKVKENNN